MSLDRIRQRVERFLEESAAERYALAKGPDRGAGLGAMYSRAGDLFHLDRIAQVQRAVSESTGLEERRARFLLEFLARGRAVCATASEVDQRLTFQVFGGPIVDDRRLTFRELRPMLAAMEDIALRRRLEEARLDALAEEEPVVQALLDRQRAEYEDLGYGSFLATCEVLSGNDLRGLAREGERFLEDTQAIHQELIGWYLPKLSGVPLADATSADIFRLQSAPHFEQLITVRDALRGEQRFLEQAGIDARAGGRIEIEEHDGLSGGRAARCVPLLVPDTVKLLLTRQAGRAAYAAQLESLGRALHHAYTAPDLPVEFRWLGDRSVPRAMGALFSGLLSDRAFLRDRFQLTGPRLADYLRLAGLLTLLHARAGVGLFLVSLAWEKGNVRALRERYVEVLGRATGVRHDAREALWSLRLPMEIAWRLRAGQLAAILTAHLRERFDEDWYRNPRTGPALLDLFAGGQRFLAAELAVQITSVQPSFAAILDRVREMVE